MEIVTVADALAAMLVGFVAVVGGCRATQIVLHDRILRRPREAVLRRVNPHGYGPGDERLGYIGYLLQCPWCVSVWIGGAIAAGLAWDESRSAVVWILVALTISLLAVSIDRAIDTWLSDEAAAERDARLAAMLAEEEPPDAVTDAFETEEP